MLDFIVSSVLPMLIGGIAVHIGRDLYDAYVKPYLVKTEAPDDLIEQQTEEQSVSEQTVTLEGFKRSGSGYTAIFK